VVEEGDGASGRVDDGEEVDEDEVERDTSPFLGIFLPDVVKDGKPEVLAEMNVNA